MKVCPTCKVEYDKGEAFCPVDATRLITPSQLAAARPDNEDPLVGSTLQDRYHIVRRIGEGGMGLVYEAMHTVIEKRMAIKVLRDDFSSRPDVVQRFRQEAKSASKIGNEHIVDISDFGETPTGASYFVMEFLEGEDLASILEREVTLEPMRAVRIVLQCCAALAAAHKKGIVHRDMKPENIFMQSRADGRDFVKIVDFGIAKMSDIETPGQPGRKLTKTGMIFGTPEYMSPEQASGRPLDHRVDIYALGVILYELVSGAVPFVGDSFMGVLTQHMFETPSPLREKNPSVELPLGLEEVILKAMAKEPDTRFQTMDEMAAALEAILRGDAAAAGTLAGYGPKVAVTPRAPRTVVAQATREESVSVPPKRRRPAVLAALAAVVLLVSGAGVWATVSRGGAPRATTAPTAPTPAPSEPALAVVEPAPRGPDAPGAVPGTPSGPGVPSATPVVDPEAVPDAGTTPSQAGVRVHVETVPTGAAVTVSGLGLECEPTPCSVFAPSGETLEVRARLGRMEGVTEVRPTGETTVQLVLAPRRSSGTRSTSTRMTATSSEMTTTSMRATDLKIPDIFR